MGILDEVSLLPYITIHSPQPLARSSDLVKPVFT